MWMPNSIVKSLLVVLAAFATTTSVSGQEIVVGNMRTLDHQVAGEVVIVNEQMLEIRNFVYDGQGRTLFDVVDCDLL